MKTTNPSKTTAQITSEAAHARQGTRICPKCGAEHVPPVNQRTAGRFDQRLTEIFFGSR